MGRHNWLAYCALMRWKFSTNAPSRSWEQSHVTWKNELFHRPWDLYDLRLWRRKTAMQRRLWPPDEIIFYRSNVSSLPLSTLDFKTKDKQPHFHYILHLFTHVCVTQRGLKRSRFLASRVIIIAIRHVTISAKATSIAVEKQKRNQNTIVNCNVRIAELAKSAREFDSFYTQRVITSLYFPSVKEFYPAFRYGEKDFYTLLEESEQRSNNYRITSTSRDGM